MDYYVLVCHFKLHVCKVFMADFSVGLDIGGAAADMFNLFSGWENQAYTRRLQKQIMSREDTAIQRRVADLKAAGLNPMFALGDGAQSSQPVQALPPQARSENMLAAMQRLQMKANINQSNADANRANAEADLARSQIDPNSGMRQQDIASLKQADASYLMSQVSQSEYELHKLLNEVQRKNISQQTANLVLEAFGIEADTRRKLIDGDIALDDYVKQVRSGLRSGEYWSGNTAGQLIQAGFAWTNQVSERYQQVKDAVSKWVKLPDLDPPSAKHAKVNRGHMGMPEQYWRHVRVPGR